MSTCGPEIFVVAYTTNQDEGQTSPVGQVLTTRREALALYRDVLRISSLFNWPDQEGRIWYVVRMGAPTFSHGRCVFFFFLKEQRT